MAGEIDRYMCEGRARQLHPTHSVDFPEAAGSAKGEGKQRLPPPEPGAP